MEPKTGVKMDFEIHYDEDTSNLVEMSIDMFSDQPVGEVTLMENSEKKPDEPSDKKVVAVNMAEEDIVYLKSRGISQTRFMRQAIQAHREGSFVFDYMKP